MSLSVGLAIGLSVAMVVVAFLTWFYHDTKHRDLDEWVQYGFSGDTLKYVIRYYQSMGISMLVFYILFVISCLALQSDGNILYVTSDGEQVVAGPIGAAFFGLDLVLRGGFFDVMEHFEMRATTLLMDRSNGWFVMYCFVFRIYFALTLIRIAFSFAYIWVRIRQARRTLLDDAAAASPAPQNKRRRFRLHSKKKSSTPA
ncbi:MAG: hypothetical protein AAFV45_02955 [Pseudomonadota bacterium]